MITEQLMATGSWNLRMREDTPRVVLDAIKPFTEIFVFPSRPPLSRPDADAMTVARWAGIVHRPGPQFEIGGPGLAGWLGVGDVSYDVDGSAVLPEGEVAALGAGWTLDYWLDAAIIPGTRLGRGTTGPTGTVSGIYQWITPRELLDSIADAFSAEWRIRPNMQLDVAAYEDLYGGVSPVVVTRKLGGRDHIYVALDGHFASAVDVEDYASRVVVLGADNRGASGGSSAWAGPEGVVVRATKVVNVPDVPNGLEATTAASIAALFNDARRQVTLSTSFFDVAGELGVGDLVSLHDPQNGIEDLAADPIFFRGQVIHPVTVRCHGITWPVRRGMGVALRAQSGATVTWTDLSDYVEFEDGDATIEIGAAARLLRSDRVAMRADLQPRVEWTAWTQYGGLVAQETTPITVGNADVDTRFRRTGTIADFAGTVQFGSTTTFGTGNFTISLPTGCVASNFAGAQMGTCTVTQEATGIVWPGVAWVNPGTGLVRFGNSAPIVGVFYNSAVPGQYSPIAFVADDRITFSLTLELEP